MKKYNLNNLDPILNQQIEVYKELFEKILPLMHVEVFLPDEKIVSFNHDIDQLRFLVSGKAKITMVHEDGKRSIIHFVMPDEFIGELTFINIEDEPKDIIAINDCICLSIPMGIAKEKLIKDAAFLLLINRYIGKKLLRRTWLNTKSQNYALKNRLAAYILMTECNGYYKEKHTDTAEYLSISYRHLLHTFKSFLDEGLLEKENRRYKIDIKALKMLSKDIND